MTRMTFTMTALVLLGLSVWVGNARADKTQLEEQLKQELSIQLENVTVAQALEQIGQKAGLRIQLSPGAVWKLPDGSNTRVSVTLAGRLSESLEKMLGNFFLRYAVGSEELTVYPRPELKRIIGRPSTADLKLLRSIYAGHLRGDFGFNTPEVPDALVQRIFKLVAGEPVLITPPEEVRTLGRILQTRATPRSSSSGRGPDANSPRVGAWTLGAILDGVEHLPGSAQTWYLQGPGLSERMPEIRIVPRHTFWEAHLDQIVDASFANERGQAIVETLAAWGDLTVRFRGSMPETLARRMTLEVQNARLRDVLERAFSALGGVMRSFDLAEGTLELGTDPTSLRPAKETPPPTSGESPSGGYVGKISIPMDGGRYFLEFMLRESDLTEELRQLRQQKLRQILEELTKAAPKAPDLSKPQ
jgi:hypothetical protein